MITVNGHKIPDEIRDAARTMLEELQRPTTAKANAILASAWHHFHRATAGGSRVYATQARREAVAALDMAGAAVERDGDPLAFGLGAMQDAIRLIERLDDLGL